MAAEALDYDLDGHQVRLTNPTKEYFPGVATKADIADYLVAVAPQMLQTLGGRPTTMERWPGGIEGEPFYQKRTPRGAPEWFPRATITFPSGRTAETLAPDSAACLVWMANLGTLRFHAWPVHAPETDVVDELRLDLDPQPGTDHRDAARAALELREVLAEAGLTGFCKTSGGRGMHVYVPVKPLDFIDARHAVIALGRELARRLPDEVTVNWWKEERGARVFVDFNQMARDRLMASAFSIRPVPNARVSTPLTWDEVGKVSPDDFTVLSVPTRLERVGDVWAGYAEAVADASTALAWYERDADNGQGEMPYPPEYPKMPGEPPRVQPSRARHRPEG